MSDLQLALDVAPERRYECCGQPAPPLSDRDAGVYLHAEDCPNPNIGTWFHRDGSPMLRLWPGDDMRMAHDRGEPCPRPDDCPVCSPERYRCAFGCCPPSPRRTT